MEIVGRAGKVMCTFGVLGLALSLAMFVFYLIQTHRTTVGGNEWAQAHARTSFALKLLIGSGVLFTLGAMLRPSVPKTVPVPTAMNDNEMKVWNKCMDRIMYGALKEKGAEIAQTCQNIAERQTDHRPTKVVYKLSPWKDIFTACVGEWSISSTEDKIQEPASVTAKLRDARIQLCANIADQQTKQIIIRQEQKNTQMGQ